MKTASPSKTSRAARSQTRLLSLCVVLAGLSGCGGGSTPPVSDTTGSSGPVIAGVAATGDAVPTGSPVSAVCASGNGTTTTQADGQYSIPASGLTLPCLLKVTWGSGEGQTELFSMARAAGTTHITPLTHVIVGNALPSGTTLQTLLANPVSATLALTANQLTDMQTRLRTVLRNSGNPTLVGYLDAVTADFFSAPLQASFSGQPKGNVHDDLLLALRTVYGSAATSVLNDQMRQATYDGSITAVVDWSECTDTPSQRAEGYWQAEQCDDNAILFHHNLNEEVRMVYSDAANLPSWLSDTGCSLFLESGGNDQDRGDWRDDKHHFSRATLSAKRGQTEVLSLRSGTTSSPYTIRALSKDLGSKILRASNQTLFLNFEGSGDKLTTVRVSNLSGTVAVGGQLQSLSGLDCTVNYTN